MTALILAWAGAAMVASGVVAYWAYTLGGVGALAPLLRRKRQLLTVSGIVIAGFGLLGHGVSVAALLPIAVAGSLFGYAERRQWLFPATAPRFSVQDGALDPAALVAVLPDGGAVPVRWAGKKRTIRIGDSLLVHCGLARSLTLFEAPPDPIAAVLPHPTGFWIGTAAQTWDGVDGTAEGGSPLVRKPLGLCTAGAWRAEYPEASWYGPADGEPLPPDSHRTPLVPGARGVQDPLAWGRVQSERWTEADTDVCPAQTQSPVYYLGRWAALRRGLLNC